MTDIEKVARAIVERLIAAIEFECPPIRDGVGVGRRTAILEQLAHDARAELAAMQPAPQWQGIESAPPPPNTRVLIAWQDWRDGKWLIEAAPYETGERVGPYSNVSRHGSATHWMPLPTPPAGGSDAE